MKAKDKNLHPGAAALLEVCILFLPAIPAYLWMWPNLEGTPREIAQSISYLYFLAGALFIGLRRWNPDRLGLNRRGIWTSLAYGSLLILGRALVVLSVDWGLPPPNFDLITLAGEFVYYFVLVGFVEELLFRGLIYRALEDWRGTRWAIWGSTSGFVLWHIFGWGPLVGAAMALYGLIFALLRRRAGGILGPALVHGTMDFTSLLITPDLDVVSLGRPEVPYPALLLLGLALILLTPNLLWRGKKPILPGV